MICHMTLSKRYHSDLTIERSAMPIETQLARSHQLKEKDQNVIPVNPVTDPRKIRRVIAEDPDWNLETVLPLVDLCIKHIISNFHIHPILDELTPLYRKKVLDGLPPSIPLSITGPLIQEEQYWDRCCHDRWKLCRIDDYDGSWKRMYFERHVEEIIECFIPLQSNEKELIDNLKLASDYVKRLRLSQLLPTPNDIATITTDEDDTDRLSDIQGNNELNRDHLDLSVYLKLLHNLQELHVSYGVNNCGMNFEWSLFEFTKNDCQQLATYVKGCGQLRALHVCRSKMTDERARLLISHLLGHPSLETLDLSHNKLGDSSGRALGKLLNGNNTITRLDVSDNMIGCVGGNSIGRALQTSRLEYMNIRLNRLADEGIQSLFKSMTKNATITHLNISSNDFTESSAVLLSEMLMTNNTLKTLDITCNKLGEAGGKLLQEGVEENRILTTLDLRLTEINAENEYTINQKIKNNADSD